MISVCVPENQYPTQMHTHWQWHTYTHTYTLTFTPHANTPGGQTAIEKVDTMLVQKNA